MSTAHSRVQITYDVETDNGVIKKELPFVVGIMGNYAGHTPTEDVTQRRFIEVKKDSLSDFMQTIKPSLDFDIPDHLHDESKNLQIHLEFRHPDDFKPEAIIEQVPELKTLQTTKIIIQELIDQANRSPAANQVLNELFLERLSAIKQEMNHD